MIPERYAPQTYALMRIVFGLMFLTYGLQKLATKPAAFLASGEMAVAYFYVHQFRMVDIGQPAGALPVQNMGIPAVLFCFAFLHFAARGAGIWSADAARGGARL